MLQVNTCENPLLAERFDAKATTLLLFRDRKVKMLGIDLNVHDSTLFSNLLQSSCAALLLNLPAFADVQIPIAV